MGKRKRTSEECKRRAKATSFRQDRNVSSVEDVRNLFKKLLGNAPDNAPEAEWDEKPGQQPEWTHVVENLQFLTAVDSSSRTGK